MTSKSKNTKTAKATKPVKIVEQLRKSLVKEAKAKKAATKKAPVAEVKKIKGGVKIKIPPPAVKTAKAPVKSGRTGKAKAPTAPAPQPPVEVQDPQFSFRITGNGYPESVFVSTKVAAMAALKSADAVAANATLEMQMPDGVWYKYDDLKGEFIAPVAPTIQIPRDVPPPVEIGLVQEDPGSKNKRYVSKTAPDSKYHLRDRSEANKPVGIVRSICEANPTLTRKEIIVLCLNAGVNKNTAATQYSLWKAKVKADALKAETEGEE